MEDEKMKKIIEDIVNKAVPPQLSISALLEVLGLTIKQDETNKIITFLCLLSAYTESSQFNISFNAPSSTGKSYLPLEVASLFPEKDVITIGYCSPTAFFHEVGYYDKSKKADIVDLSRKILIFLDQPHTLLLQHLRPLLSHDKKEISVKITDKKKGVGHRTKHIIIIGFPAVIFCTAGLRLDEQEATRFFLLSPETTQGKIRQAVHEKVLRETDRKGYMEKLESDPNRQALKKRIEAIKNEHIEDIKITSPDRLERAFLELLRGLKPRHARDVGRLMSLVKALALLNLCHRDIEGHSISANNDDMDQALKLWSDVAQSQEYNLPPYVYNLYLEIIKSLCEEHPTGVTRIQIIQKHYKTYDRSMPDWQLRREILPMLEMAGLISQEQDPQDKRRKLIYCTGIGDKEDSGVSPPEKEVDGPETPPSLF